MAGERWPVSRDEARILGVGDGLHAEEEVVDVNAVERTLILFGVLGTHEEFAGGNQRELGREVGRHARVSQEDSASALFDYTLAR